MEFPLQNLMAQIKFRLAQNAPGAFYVDDSCIQCDACVVEAPTVFAMNDEKQHAYVLKQPVTPQELADAQNALAACPVEAIGEDGFNQK